MNRKTVILLPILVAMSVAIGILIGNMLKNNASPVFSGGMNLAHPNKIATVLDLIDHGYVDNVNTGDIIEKTIPEILENLDPHTSYIPAKNMQEVQEEMQGNFSGIGVQFSVM